VLKYPSGSAHDSGERIFRYVNGQAGFKTNAFVETFEKGSAARKHYSAV
jgi:hypothetical protein